MKEDESTNTEDQIPEEFGEPENGGYPGPLRLDVEKYRKHVDHYDISEKQKLALLQTLWNIMRMMAEVGYGVDSVQRFIPALAQFSEQSESLHDFSGVAESKDVRMNITATNFNSAAQKETPQKDQRDHGISKES